MGIKQSLVKNLTAFGKNNSSPTIVAMGIASAKGIFRPTFTMMDTKENYETRRYAALREGLTELIAIPVYYLSGVLSKYTAKKLATPKNFMSKNIYQKFKNGDTSKEVMTAFGHAKELAEINKGRMTTTASFIGVCISALFIIPCVCSATIKPIMKNLEKKNSAKQVDNTNPVKNVTVQKPNNNVQSFKALYINNNYGGMKVGGL